MNINNIPIDLISYSNQDKKYIITLILDQIDKEWQRSIRQLLKNEYRFIQQFRKVFQHLYYDRDKKYYQKQRKKIMQKGPSYTELFLTLQSQIYNYVDNQWNRRQKEQTIAKWVVKKLEQETFKWFNSKFCLTDIFVQVMKHSLFRQQIQQLRLKYQEIKNSFQYYQYLITKRKEKQSQDFQIQQHYSSNYNSNFDSNSNNTYNTNNSKNNKKSKNKKKKKSKSNVDKKQEQQTEDFQQINNIQQTITTQQIEQKQQIKQQQIQQIQQKEQKEQKKEIQQQIQQIHKSSFHQELTQSIKNMKKQQTPIESPTIQVIKTTQTPNKKQRFKILTQVKSLKVNNIPNISQSLINSQTVPKTQQVINLLIINQQQKIKKVEPSQIINLIDQNSKQITFNDKIINQKQQEKESQKQFLNIVQTNFDKQVLNNQQSFIGKSNLNVSMGASQQYLNNFTKQILTNIPTRITQIQNKSNDITNSNIIVTTKMPEQLLKTMNPY